MFEIFKLIAFSQFLYFLILNSFETKLTRSPCAVTDKFSLFVTPVLENVCSVYVAVNKINFFLVRHFVMLRKHSSLRC